MSFRARASRKTNATAQARARGVLGARRYTASELSGSRPAEPDGCRGLGQSTRRPPDSRRIWRARRSTAASFTTAIPLSATQSRRRSTRLFWEDYDDSNDGIYSAVSRVREVLRDEMTYTEMPSEAPGARTRSRGF